MTPWRDFTEQDHVDWAEEQLKHADALGGFLLNLPNMEALEARYGTLSAWLGDRRADFGPFVPLTEEGRLLSFKDDEDPDDHSPMIVDSSRPGLAVFCGRHGILETHSGTDHGADLAGLTMIRHALADQKCTVVLCALDVATETDAQRRKYGPPYV